MKKLLLLAAAALVSTAASAQWAVVGAYSDPNWNFEASTTFEGEGDDLSCTIDYLIGDFKIVDITNNNWDTQYGTATPININTPYVLDGKNGGDDPSNIKFDGLIQAVKNATVKWNPSTATLEIVASESDLVIAYPTLYITGSFCSWNAPGEGGSVLCSQSNGVYTVKVDLGSAERTEFKLAGSGWSNEIAGGVEINATEGTKVTRGGENLFTTLTGEQTLTFNYETMVMTFGDPELANEVPADPDPVWAVVGAYTSPDWNFEASTLLEADGDLYTGTIDLLTNDFKIINIVNNNWDYAYGTSEAIEIGKAATLENGGDNITFAGLVQTVANAKITWNPETLELTVDAEAGDIVEAYPVLYITGSFCDWANPGEEGTIVCTENDGVYTVTVDLGEGDDEGKTEFKLAGLNWANQICGGVEITEEGSSEVSKSGDNLYTYLTGTQTLTFNYANMKMTFGNPDSTSFADVVVNDNCAPVYYNLQGVRVQNPVNGLYIVKEGNKTSKVFVR